MIIKIVSVRRATVSILITVCPWALILTVWSDELLLHSSVIRVNRSWLSPTLFISLGLLFQSLGVLLISSDQLNFFLGSFAVRVLTRILVGRLVL